MNQQRNAALTVAPLDARQLAKAGRFWARWARHCGFPLGPFDVVRSPLDAFTNDSEDRILLCQCGEEIAACAVVDREPALSRCVAQTVFSLEKGLPNAFLEALLQRSEAAGLALLHIPAIPNSALSKELAGAAFRPVRAYARLRVERCDAPRSTSGNGPLRLSAYREVADAAEAATLQNACFLGAFGYQPNRPHEIARLVVERGGRQNLWIARDAGGVAVAYVWISTGRDAKGELAGRIEMMGVCPDSRGRGYGRWVLAAGMEELWRRGAARIELDVDSENSAANALYRSFGFVESYAYSWFEKAAG